MARSAVLPAFSLAFLAALSGVTPGVAATRPPAPVYQAQVINAELTGGLLVGGSQVLLVWGSDGTILRSEDGARWLHAVTPTSADLIRATSNDGGGVIVAVGAQGTILRSTDAGRTWQAARTTTLDTDLRAVVNHPGTRTWVAAGTNGRLVRSIDDGKNWSLVDSQLKVDFQTLFVDTKTQFILIGGDEGMVGHSKDAGMSWQVTALAMPDPATPITAFHRFGKLLLATSALGRFLTSEDDAQSWDLMQAGTNAFFTDCAFDPVRDAIVMTGHNGDVLRSPDGGKSWEGGEVTLDGRKNFLTSIRFDERSGSLIVIGQGGTVARSIDGGVSWSRASEDFHGDVRGLVKDTVRNRLVAFGAGGMVMSSIDSGIRWNDDRTSLDLWLREIEATPRGNALIATSKLGEIIRSTDGGTNWRVMPVTYPNPNTPPDLRGLAVTPSGNAMIAVGPPGAILRSDPDGNAWVVRHSTPIEAERALPWVLVDAQQKILVAVETRGEMQVSRDDGETWQASSIPIAEGKWPFWHGTVHAGVMLIGGQSGKAARSTDGARTWSYVDTGTDKDVFGSFANEVTGTFFLAGADGTLLRSTDLGVSWKNIPTGSTQELRRLMRDPRTGALLCYGAHGTILRSQDDGLTWRPASSGTDGVLRKGVLEPRTGNLLLVGGQGALLRSRDGGRTWEVLPTHTPRHFSSMWADDRTGDLVLVGERIVRLVRPLNGKIGRANEQP
ncbi:MAG TPA: YCF48-related protein [Steroidobacteraceae bacterium]